MTVHPSKLSPSALSKNGLTGAECVYDPELHTGLATEIESEEGREARIEVARAVCLTCPVMAQCLDRAICGRPRPGVWGGFEAQTLIDLFAGLGDDGLGEAA